MSTPSAPASNSSSPSYSLGSSRLSASSTITQIMFTFAGIALYNTIELICLLLLTFNRYRGLYFWSLLLASVGILPYTIFLLFKFFAVLPSRYNMLDVAFLDVGWQLMVTGQSVVMYSRLHLLERNARVLTAVRWMIIANWFVSNIPTTILVFLGTTADGAKYEKVYGVWERLQLVLYFCQEVIISIIYIKAIFGLSSDGKISKLESWKKLLFGRKSYKPWEFQPVIIMRHLVQMNILVICLDVSLLVMEFAGYYDIQVMYKGALYSVKLKIEFWILNQLTAMASRKLRSSNQDFGSGFQDISATDTAVESGTTELRKDSQISPSPLGPNNQRSHSYQFPPPTTGIQEMTFRFPTPEPASLKEMET